MPDRAKLEAPAERQALRVLVVNSMADGALQRTERQFAKLLDTGAGGPTLQFVFTTLPEVPRADWGRAHVAEHYIGLDRALAIGADAMVVTGAEPRHPRLEDEPYWRSLTRVLDWADASGVPTILSCLAAHAGVQHFDGIRRIRMAEKCSGLFEHEKMSNDALTSGLPEQVVVAHSRWNQVSETALAAAGYQVMTRSDIAGVDLFVRNGASRWLLFQGHPEYEPDNLWREYQRDVRRFLDSEADGYPNIPVGFGSPEEIVALERFRERATEERAPELADEMPAINSCGQTESSPMNSVIRNWFRDIRTHDMPVDAKAG